MASTEYPSVSSVVLPRAPVQALLFWPSVQYLWGPCIVSSSYLMVWCWKNTKLERRQLCSVFCFACPVSIMTQRPEQKKLQAIWPSRADWPARFCLRLYELFIFWFCAFAFWCSLTTCLAQSVKVHMSVEVHQPTRGKGQQWVVGCQWLSPKGLRPRLSRWVARSGPRNHPR